MIKSPRMKLKKLVASFFLLSYLFVQVFITNVQPAFASGSCGTDLYQGKLTGCFAINVGGNTVQESGWDCGPLRQCFYFENYKGKCGKDFYTDSSGQRHITFCSISKFGRQSADGFPGCGTGETCIVGPYVGNQSCNWVLDGKQLKFCAGGFSDADSLHAAHLEFQCVGGNCGGAGLIGGTGGNQVQTVNMSGADIGDSDEGKYTCYALNFDSQVKDVIDYYTKLGKASCYTGMAGAMVVTVAGAGLLAGPAMAGAAAAGEAATLEGAGATWVAGQVVTAGVKAATIVAIPVAVEVTSGNACIDAAAKYRPTIEGRVIRSDGSLACLRQLTVTLNANGEVTPTQEESNFSFFNLCNQIPSTNSSGQPNRAKSDCEACDSQQKVWTAFGCIPTTFQDIAGTLIKVGLSIAGGFALLMILMASFMLTTSQGDLKRAGDARELLTSAVMGLLFIIFSVTILQFIGVKILQIPGFGV
jgi:hypothetical protein